MISFCFEEYLLLREAYCVTLFRMKNQINTLSIDSDFTIVAKASTYVDLITLKEY